MSENQNRGTTDFSRYDSMTTEELEEILRLDSQAPEGRESDEELLLYIMEVLARRKRNSNKPGKTAQTAWESFEKHYLPQEKEAHIEANKPEKKARPHLRRWIAVAAVIAVLVGVPLASAALNWDDLRHVVAVWTKDGTFSFKNTGDPTPTEPTKQNIPPFESLKDMLIQSNKSTDMVPEWMPEGFVLEDLRMDGTPKQKVFLAFYKNGERTLRITILAYLHTHPDQVEISGDPLDIYTASGVDYYIFSNNKENLVVWLQDSYECRIAGDLTVDEIKQMINSIGKG